MTLTCSQQQELLSREGSGWCGKSRSGPACSGMCEGPQLWSKKGKIGCYRNNFKYPAATEWWAGEKPSPSADATASGLSGTSLGKMEGIVKRVQGLQWGKPSVLFAKENLPLQRVCGKNHFAPILHVLSMGLLLMAQGICRGL